jgi:hypothetical protein
LGLVTLQRRKQAIDALEQPIIDDTLVFEGRDLVSAAGPLLMDLGLLGPDEGFLVDVWVNFDV